jgi:hypothetical protein
MRIVFLLFAEERGLLPEHDLYRTSYAISSVRERLQREATSTSVEALDHSWETWHRLLAASNAVFGGATFQDMRMPAYGGSLFDPSRFPWLHATDASGRLRVRLTDRAMLAVLRAVQTIEDGAMQLSFRDLDVEQIGYVYEGLLGYSAEYVSEVTVGLQGKAGFEPEIALTELETIAESATAPADFAKRLVDHLKKTQEQSKPRTANQIAKAFAADDVDGAVDARTRLRHTLLGDDDLAGRLQPFHGLIRNDLRGFPYVVPAGGLVMTESPQRANTGTHYTPRSLAEEVVLHALQPLVYSPGPLDNEDGSEWRLKSSAEILDLKIADIAAGSGAFLVAAARYLADRLIEARAHEGLDVSGEPDLKRWAVREVVARCLYGADINGMAVEMCKLSLWLISMDPGKPFSFVDDRVFHGNSLLGVTTEEQLKAQHIYPERRRGQGELLRLDVDKDLDDAARIRRELSSGQVDDADRMRSTKAKQALLAQAEKVTAKLRDVADGIIAAGLLEGGKPGTKLDDKYVVLADALRAAYPDSDDVAPDRTKLDAIIARGLTPTVDTGEARWKPLHWILEAPDVIHTHGGFDAIIGNPPFLGAKRIAPSAGLQVRSWLVEVCGDHKRGNADLVAYFFLRGAELLTQQGNLGLIATDSVGQGDTRIVGLDALLAGGATIFRGIRTRPWPTRAANINAAVVWLTRRTDIASQARSLDDVDVDYISSGLEPGAVAPLIELNENSGIAFQGSNILGRGFVLTPSAARAVIASSSHCSTVVKPYLNGEDLNTSPDSAARRWVIDFGERSEAEARTFVEPFQIVEERVLPQRATKDALRYPRMVNEWWKFWNPRKELYAAIQPLKRVIAMARVSAALAPRFVPANQVFDEKVVVFATEDYADFALLSSEFHRLFALRYGTTLGTTPTYTPKAVFRTFPRPRLGSTAADAGKHLDELTMRVQQDRAIGATRLTQLVSSRHVNDEDIWRIRSAMAIADAAIASCYGWSDIELDHEFSEYRGAERWSVGPKARTEILDRLLEENHRRARLEAESAPAKKPKRGKSLSETEKPEGAMF